MPGKIFINYRRGDDPGYTQALYQRLEDEFASGDLFMDVEYIKPGDNFVDVISDQVAAADVVLVVIGPRWSDLLAARIGDGNDFVVIEIKAALDQGKRVIPVLVGGASMPRSESVPESIRTLALRQAVGLRPERFKADCQGLVTALKESLPAAVQERAARTETERKVAEEARLNMLAADQGNARAQYILGVFYESGSGGLPKDEREAARLYKLAADQGYVNAQFNLGVFYANGRGGLPKDDREAARFYKLAADQGDADGQTNLGVFIANGRGGLPKDEREAARLYKLAADQGKAPAQNNLGGFYRDGRGLSKDDREAARLYKLAADQGNAGAQYNLGVLYANGRGGLSKDDREAARLFKLAADQGYADAQFNLGFRGGQDEREAARLFKLSADQGDADAQANLGWCYEYGRGLPKDEREAARLYKLAADQGNDFAKTALLRLTSGR
jgi:TPR repeat protein